MASQGRREGRRAAPLARVIKELAEAAVDGLHEPIERLSQQEERRARQLTRQVAADLRPLAEGDRAHKAALREAVGATTLLFEAHPLSAGELVALDQDPTRATQTLLTAGETTLADLSAPAASLVREILPRIMQQLLADRSMISELANSTLSVGPQATVTLLRTITGHEGAVASAVFSPTTGSVILTASEDTTARLWSAASGQEQRMLEADAALWNASYSGDGSRIATASHDHTARVWDAANGQQLLTIAGHEEWVRSAVFSSDGAMLLTASYDNTARLWDATSGAPIRTLPHGQRVHDANFSPDDSRIVTGCDDMVARIWDAATGQELLALQGHERQVVSAAYNADGTRIVTASHDFTARIWDAASGQSLQTLQGHSGQVRRAAFSPDGTLVVTASDDRSARLWDAATGLQLAQLDGHADWVFSAAFGPNGREIVTASGDQTTKVWDCDVTRARRVLVAQRGRIRIPARFREALGIDVGDLVTIELDQDVLHVRPLG